MPAGPPSIRSVPCVLTQGWWVEPRFAWKAGFQKGETSGVIRSLGIAAVVAFTEAFADNLDEFL